MDDYQKLVDIFLDELPEEHPWIGNIKGVVDRLIAEGVTFATDNNVGDKLTPTAWIPVTERLPEKEMEVIVYTGNILKPSVFCYHFWTADLLSWQSVTHWMPLPEPPKGE